MSFTKITDPVALQRDIILIYGPPGSGKTRLATSLPEDRGKIAYFAFDPGSETLASVLPKYRDRITVFRPEWKDPTVEASEVAFHNWKESGFNSLILDTHTIQAQRILQFCAEKGMFNNSPKHVGRPGTPEYTVIPTPADYGGAQTIVMKFIGALLEHQRELNIYVLCHQYLRTKDDEGKGDVLGGPAIIGKGLLEALPGRFPTIIRMDRNEKTVVRNGRAEKDITMVARLSQHGVWMARRNESSDKGNQLKAVELEIDPLNFWTAYDSTR